MQNKRLQRLVLSASFAALTAVFIWLIHIPYGTTGYVHLGDTVIYLCACLLPTPYAVLSAAVGAGLADFLSGFPVYIIPTVLIKAAMSACFSNKAGKFLTKRNVLALCAALLLNVALYAVTEYVFGRLLYGMPAAGAASTAALTLPQNALQSAANTALFLAFAAALDRFRLKQKFEL